MNLRIHVGGVGLAMLTVAAPAPVSAQAQPDFSKVEITCRRPWRGRPHPSSAPRPPRARRGRAPRRGRWLLATSPGHDRASRRAGSPPEGVRVAPEERVRREGEVPRRRPPDRVALARRAPAGLTTAAQEGAELLHGELAGGTAPGVATEPCPPKGDPAPVVGDDLLRPRRRTGRRQPAAGHLDVAVDDDRIARPARPTRRRPRPATRCPARWSSRRGRRRRRRRRRCPRPSDLAPGGERHRPGRRDRHASTHGLILPPVQRRCPAAVHERAPDR